MDNYSVKTNLDIDWIGEVPSSWTFKFPKYVLNRVTRDPHEDDKIITCFRDGVVTLRENRRQDGFTNSLQEHGYQRILPGDLVVHQMDGFAGAIGISDSKGKSTPVYTVIEPDGKTNLRYVVYLLREMARSGKITSLAKSIRQRSTEFKWEMWSSTKFPFPPLPEQTAIANYLDEKTAQIDSLIEKIQRKIELLKEQRTALINQAVTKGLDPNVEMKDSGIEWIGEIPSSWSLKRVGDYFSNRSQTVDDKMFPPLSVTMNGIVDQLEYVAKTDNTDNRKLVREGDFVINSRSDRKGSSGLSKRDGSVSVINIVLEPRQIIATYVEYLFKSYYFKEEFFRNGKGIHWDLWSTRWDQLKSIVIPVPNQNTQTAIANYLDEKTTQIDSLIEKIQRKIELLKEQRIAVINQAVTKGLDPNVEMKDSGVEWIGEIPDHWSRIRMKNVMSPLGGRSTTGDEELLSVTIHEGVIARSDYVGIDEEYLSRADTLVGYKLVRENNLVNNIMKMGFRCLGVSRYDGIVSPAYSVFELSESKVSPDYINYLLRIDLYVSEYKKRSKGIQESRMRLYDDYFLAIDVAIPPLREQQHISNYLDHKTQQIDSTIEKETQRIELLNEYRQSLISNVVTGKVRVVEEVA